MHEKELGDHGSYSAFALCTATWTVKVQIKDLA